MNFKAYTKDENYASLYTAISTDKSKPNYLSASEIERRKHYIIRASYYLPGKDGLYQTEIGDGEYLSDLRYWTSDSQLPVNYYPPEMWGAFNPVPRVVNLDVAALMNEFEPDGIQVLQEDGETTDDALTEFVRKVFQENGFFSFFTRLFTLSGSMGDAYVHITHGESAAEPEYMLNILPADIVFPVLDFNHRFTERAIRLLYNIDTTLNDDEDNPHLYSEQETEYYAVMTKSGFSVYLDGEHRPEYDVEYTSGIIPVVHFPILR